MTGTPKVRSSSAITLGGSAEDDDRISRSGDRAMASRLASARARIDWWMVGTAVYQVDGDDRRAVFDIGSDHGRVAVTTDADEARGSRRRTRGRDHEQGEGCDDFSSASFLAWAWVPAGPISIVSAGSAAVRDRRL
jgi:hypothetical protein